MLVAESSLTHIGQLDGALGARVHEPVAAHRVELGGGDDLGELLHVRRLDIHDVEALVLNVQIPQVYAEIITADECLAVAVDRYAVDVVCVGVGVGLPGHSCHDGVMVGQTRQLQITRILDDARQSSWCAASPGDAARSGLGGEVVFCDHLQGLLEDFPQLDGLVVRREEVVGSVLSTTPFDLVDLLFDLEGLEVIEFGLVGLELGVELVLASFFLPRQLENAHDDDADIIESKRPAAHSLVALEQNNPPTLVTSRQIVARVVELNGRYDIGYR